MERLLAITCSLILVTTITTGLEATVEDSCSQGSAVISISNSTDAHAAEIDYYEGFSGPGNQRGKQVCLTDIDYSILRDSCTDQETPILSLSNTTNAHAGEPGHYTGYTGPGGQNGKQVCVHGISSTYIKEECGRHETSILSLSAREDAHIAVPGYYNLQLCTSNIENVSLNLEWEHENSEKRADSEEVEGTGYIDSQDTEMAYISSENSSLGQDMLFGLVNFGNFQEMTYEINGDRVRTEMVQEFSTEDSISSFIIPFTEATYSSIESRRGNIQGGIFDNPDFFEYSNPNFAYEMTDKKIITATLSYPEENIDLKGFESSISGSQVLYIRNQGESEKGGRKVSVTR